MKIIVTISPEPFSIKPALSGVGIIDPPANNVANPIETLCTGVNLKNNPIIIPEANPIMALEIVIDNDKNASDGYSFPIYLSSSPSKAPGTKHRTVPNAIPLRTFIVKFLIVIFSFINIISFMYSYPKKVTNHYNVKYIFCTLKFTSFEIIN